MRKISLPIFFLLIFLSLFFEREVLAVVQEAYIVLVEYSIDDPSFGPYNPATGKGVIAWIEDTNGPTSGGKVYRVAPSAPTRFYPGSIVGFFEYEGDRITDINTTIYSKLYSRYTVKNTGTYPIEDLSTWGGSIDWGTETFSTGWSTDDFSILRLGYLNPGETKYEIYFSEIKDFPKGYIWKPIVLGWPDGNTMPNENDWGKATFYALGPDFSPPKMDCPTLPDKEIEYGGTYTNTCTYQNSSSETVYLELSSSFSTGLCGTWGARWTPAQIPHKAIFYHYFGSEKITLNPGQTLNRDTTATIGEIDSPDHRNVNLSHLGAGYYHYLCLDSTCTKLSSLYLCRWPTIGHGAGKYLGIKDPGTLSTTVIGANDKPAYRTYFDLWNPDTNYNEIVGEEDYYIDIQILKEGDDWYQDASTALRHYKFLVEDLEQEPGATPVFPGVFSANDDNAYPFFYEIPDIDQIPPDQAYELYITTIWINHPRTNVDEPIDQIARSFAPGLYLKLENIYLSAGQYTLTTSNNYIWNFSSFPLDVEINLTENIPQFSISTSLPINFTLGPGEKRFFQVDFQYSGNKPSSDVNGNLFGNSFIQISDNLMDSDTDIAPIFIEKSANSPPNKPTSEGVTWSGGCAYVIAIPTFQWIYDDPDDDPQAGYQIRVRANSNFPVDGQNNPILQPDEFKCGGQVCSAENQYTYFSPIPQEWIGWAAHNTNYYWTVRVKDNLDNWSEWSDPCSFNTPAHTYPEPDFTHDPETPSAGQEVTFIDDSVCYDTNNSPYSCKDNAGNRYLWDFGDGNSCDSNINSGCRGDVTHNYEVQDDYTVTLFVTDNLGTCDTNGDTPVSIRLPLPEYKEVPPIIWLENLFAGIINFFDGFLKI